MSDAATQQPHVQGSGYPMALRCAGCGANLAVDSDADHLTCGYCGTPQQVLRRGGTIRLHKIENAIAAVQRGTDKTAAELAIPRLEREILEIEADRLRQLAQPIRASTRAGLSNLVLLLLICSAVAFFSMIALMSKDLTEGFAIRFAWFVWLAGLASGACSWVALKVLRRNDRTNAKVLRNAAIDANAAAEVLKLREALAGARAIVNSRS